MPCTEKRARLLLERNRARVVRREPFVMRLIDRLVEDSALQPCRLKIDPGSKTTGIAVVRVEEAVDVQSGELTQHLTALLLMELAHRGALISKKLASRASYRRRRRGNLRYRAPRFLNRTRPTGWLPPSLQHRVDSTMAWVRRLARYYPITSLSCESVRFDTQKLQNPEISGIEYQQGTLDGYEVKEYLLEKHNRTCVYCDATDIPLEVEHILARSKGGSNRIYNLTLACVACNRAKNSQPVAEFLAHDPARLARVLEGTKQPLRDAAAVNATKTALIGALQALNLPLELASGAQTKFNRHRLGIPKTHALDAACVGSVDTLAEGNRRVLSIKSTGRGSYCRTRVDQYGFPRGYLTRKKSVQGFATGDLVRAVVSLGKKQGTYQGRVAVRASGSFNIQTPVGLIQGISYRYCTLIQRVDGYSYTWTPGALFTLKSGRDAPDAIPPRH